MQQQQFDELDEMARETGLKKIFLIEQAVEMYYRHYKEEQRPASFT